MAALFDAFLVYQFLRKLCTPFDETEAYRLGLIDANGKRLKQATTTTEKNADTPADRLILNLRRLIMKLGGGSYLAMWAAALFLLHEEKRAAYWNSRPARLTEAFKLACLQSPPIQLRLVEDAMAGAPANNAGGGNVAGMGVGPQGEPGVPRKKKKTPLVAAMLRRKRPVMEGQEMFAGHPVFEVDSDTFHRMNHGKKKFVNYKHAVSEKESDDTIAAIQQHGNADYSKPVIIKDKLTGYMQYLRRGK